MTPTTNALSRDFEQRHHTTGAILAAAIGDALGSPTEFMSLPAIHARYGPQGVTGFERWRTTPAGHRHAPYTDDTQLAEVVLRSLLATRPHSDIDALMAHLAPAISHWSTHPQGGHRAPGNACLSGARSLAQGIPWREAGGPTAGGCGSVMRAWPFGLVFHHDEDRALTWAAEHSRSTHGDPLALASCAAIAAGTARALNHHTPDHVVAGMIEAANRYDIGTALMLDRAANEARSGVAPTTTLNRLRGWAGHEAVSAAAYVFLRHPDDPRAALLEGANTPGDSDSIASLAGALVGARCGFTALPSDWVRDVERSAELQELGTKAASAA